MGLATGTAKTLLFVFNFLFFVSGILIITIGGIVLTEQKPLEEKVDFSTVTGAAVVLIVVGVFIMFISFFGCYGAISSSYCMLMTFACLLILIFVLEFAAGIAAYVKRDDIKKSFKEGLFKVFHENYDKTNLTLNNPWDAIQKEWLCCGVDNYKDFYTTPNFNDTTELPGSCCGFKTGVCSPSNTTEWNKATNDTDGCYHTMADIIEKNVGLIGGIGVGIAFIQILGITLACCLGTNVKNHL